jgi:hypothetical protein
MADSALRLGAPAAVLLEAAAGAGAAAVGAERMASIALAVTSSSIVPPLTELAVSLPSTDSPFKNCRAMRR